MTRLECAIELLKIYHRYDYPNSEDTKAIAYAIMEIGKSELREEIKDSAGKIKQGNSANYCKT